MALMPSIAPTALNAQQEPHISWFFTSVTAPRSRQSMAEGASASAYAKGVAGRALRAGEGRGRGCWAVGGCIWELKVTV